MLAKIIKLFERAPQHFLLFRFSDRIEEAQIIKETDEAYHVRFRTVIFFNVPIPNWEEWLPKNHPRIVEIFCR